MFWGLGGAAAMLVLLIVVAAIIPKLRKTATVVPNGVKVEVRTSPPGATIRVNGKIRGTSNFQFEDVPGSYRIDASLEGYQPASITAELKRRATAPLELTLQPLPQTVSLITDLADGKVFLDNQPAYDVRDGQATFDAVAPGKHTLKLASRSGQAQLEFELVQGAAPQLTTPPQVKTAIALVVGSFGDRAGVYTTLSGAKAQLDGSPAGDVGAAGLQLTNLTSGAHEIVVGNGKTQLKRIIEIAAAPALTLFFQSDQNIGTFVILTGEDGADVFVDGKKYKRQTSGGGQLRIQKEPKEYRISVAKQGFEEAPEMVVRIAKGEERKVVFKLTPLPTTAHLSLQGSPGAQVLIDQNAAGTVPPDGTFQVSNLSPGEHVIELRKDKQHSQPVRRAFTAGQTVTLASHELALRGGPGTLKLNVSPPGAVVTATHAGRPPQTINGATIELDEGTYTISARAPGYGEHSEPVQIVGGQTASVNIALAREQKKSTAMGMEGWDNGAWARDGEWYVRHGGGLVLCHAPNRPGTYGFNIMLSAGGSVLRGKSVQWVAGFKDERNYVLYRLEKDDLRRFNIVNGKRVELPRKPHGLKLKDVMASVQVEVSAAGITTRLRNGDQWAAVDSWAAPDRNFADSRFGILIEGKDEVRLSGFDFYPKE
jgi:hypothetical protein